MQAAHRIRENCISEFKVMQISPPIPDILLLAMQFSFLAFIIHELLFGIYHTYIIFLTIQ